MFEAEESNLSLFPTMELESDIVESDDVIFPDQSLAIGPWQDERLNESQKGFVDAVLKAVDAGDHLQSNQTCFYVDGPAGSGKTFVFTPLWHLLDSKKKSVSSMAYTGTGATLLPNGKTVHRTFGLPACFSVEISSSFQVKPEKSQDLKKVDVFIWDNAPMAPFYFLDTVDRILREITKDCRPFGGKIVVLGGDFRQLPPVHEPQLSSVDLSIKNSDVWSYFSQFSLTQNMRASPNQDDFAKFLLGVENGASRDNLLLPDRCVMPSGSNIAVDVFGQYSKDHDYHAAGKCAILSPTNAKVDKINKMVVKLLDYTSEKIYTSVGITEYGKHVADKINEKHSETYLNSLSSSNLCPHKLRLRKYSIVMLIKSLHINGNDLCSGTRLLILNLNDDVLHCEILTGDRVGKEVDLPRVIVCCENIDGFRSDRLQFPVKLAVAMTIHKSEGQTFEKIAIDLRKDVFTHGQLYVAFSRVRSWDSLKVYLDKSRNSNFVKNCVYKGLF